MFLSVYPGSIACLFIVKIAKIEKTKFDGRSSNRITFLAIPPQAFSTVSPLVKKYGYSAKGANRVIIEKPWGHDSDSAVKLIERIRADWDEEEVYAVDHLLAADMVRNIIPIRFGNSWVEPLLNRDNVASITCSFAEHFGVEGRGSFLWVSSYYLSLSLCLTDMFCRQRYHGHRPRRLPEPFVFHVFLRPFHIQLTTSLFQTSSRVSASLPWTPQPLSPAKTSATPR